jgi:DNA-binding transcriptional ArsR family regulator
MDSYARVLWWLFSSSAGAATRGRIVRAIRTAPQNAQQLALGLGLDYTTVRHHLKVLVENRLLESSGPHYGQVYALAAHVEERWPELEHILERHRSR